MARPPAPTTTTAVLRPGVPPARPGGARTPQPARAGFRRALAAAAAALTCIAPLAACGSSSGGTAPASPSPSGSAASFPVTVTGGNGSITLAAAPAHIVSLSPTATEMLFAIGAGGQVKAVDDQSSYPAQAPRTKLSGFQPNVEAVAAYQPDLVVYSEDTNGLSKGLATLKVPALQLAAASTLDDTFAQLATLGRATGHASAAAAVVARTTNRIDAAVASVPKAAKPLSVYHELDTTYYSVTSSTFIGGIYQRFGLKNIADQAPDAAGGYPKLSAEFVAEQDPDVVVLADGTCCGQSASTFALRAAFGGLSAVTSHRVIVIDDDIASRWGPRVADFAEAVAAGLKQG